jgi:hypothetical protein
MPPTTQTDVKLPGQDGNETGDRNNQDGLATTELLQAAIQNAFTNGEPYFTNIWTEFTGTNPQKVAAGQSLLLGLAKNHPIFPTEYTTTARRRLLRYHVIEQIENDGKETGQTIEAIEIPLLAQWVRERAIQS